MHISMPLMLLHSIESCSVSLAACRLCLHGKRNKMEYDEISCFKLGKLVICDEQVMLLVLGHWNFWGDRLMLYKLQYDASARFILNLSLTCQAMRSFSFSIFSRSSGCSCMYLSLKKACGGGKRDTGISMSRGGEAISAEEERRWRFGM